MLSRARLRAFIDSSYACSFGIVDGHPITSYTTVFHTEDIALMELLGLSLSLWREVCWSVLRRQLVDRHCPLFVLAVHACFALYAKGNIMRDLLA